MGKTFELAKIPRTVSFDVNGNATLDDNKKIILGTGTDLEVFHNGSNSIINDAGTGNLQLQVGGSTQVDIGASAITFNSTVTGPTTDTLLIKNSAGTTLKTIRGV